MADRDSSSNKTRTASAGGGRSATPKANETGSLNRNTGANSTVNAGANANTSGANSSTNVNTSARPTPNPNPNPNPTVSANVNTNRSTIPNRPANTNPYGNANSSADTNATRPSSTTNFSSTTTTSTTASPSSTANANSTTNPSSTASGNSNTSRGGNLPPTEFSLSSDFAGDLGPQYAATALIVKLIEAASREVDTLKRNALTSYQLLSRARDICKAINSLIRVVETEDTDSWDNYEKYTIAIIPLEDVLFKLMALAESESLVWLLADGTVGELASSVTEWQDRRKDLRALLNHLYDAPGFKALLGHQEGDAGRTSRRDDLTFLTALCNGVTTSRTRSVKGALFRAVQTEAKDILLKISDVTTEPLIVQTIRGAMFVHGVVAILGGKIESDACKLHLASDTVWMKANELLSSILRHLQETQSTSEKQAALKAQVDDFEKLLLTVPSEVRHPENYWDLQKAAKDVRRPYLAQTFVLLQQTRVLAEWFGQEGNGTADNLRLLTDAVDAVKQALLDAAAVMDSTGVFDENTDKAKTAKAAFSAAEQAVQNCFKEFRIEMRPSREMLLAAQEEDRQRVMEMNNRSSSPSKDRGPPKLVEVVLKNMSTKTTLSYSVDPSTCLSAMLWKESTRNPALLNGWHFKDRPDRDRGKRFGLETQVKDLPESEGKRVVYLVGQ